jgi:hypothetical protein
MTGAHRLGDHRLTESTQVLYSLSDFPDRDVDNVDPSWALPPLDQVFEPFTAVVVDVPEPRRPVLSKEAASDLVGRWEALASDAEQGGTNVARRPVPEGMIEVTTFGREEPEYLPGLPDGAAVRSIAEPIHFENWPRPAVQLGRDDFPKYDPTRLIGHVGIIVLTVWLAWGASQQVVTGWFFVAVGALCGIEGVRLAFPRQVARAALWGRLRTASAWKRLTVLSGGR